MVQMTPVSNLSKEVLDSYERFCPGILSEVMHEVVRAEKLHGSLPADVVRASAIAGEEMGEVCEATLDYTRDSFTPLESRRKHLREEWIQLAAVAFRAIENLDKEDGRGSDS